MATTNWFGGRTSLDLGAANLYVKAKSVSAWDVATGWIDVGLVDSLSFRTLESKTDLRAAQKGDRAADKVITSQGAQLECGLGESYAERVDEVTNGVYLSKDTAGAVTQAMFTKRLGARDSDNLVWVKAVKIEAGAESTDPLEVVYMLAAISTDNVELVYDATSQRFWRAMFEAYENDDAVDGVSDASGRPAYWWTDIAP